MSRTLNLTNYASENSTQDIIRISEGTGESFVNLEFFLRHSLTNLVKNTSDVSLAAGKLKMFARYEANCCKMPQTINQVSSSSIKKYAEML